MSTRGGFSLSFIYFFWILSVYFSSLVQAQISVVSPSSPLHVSAGSDVVLSCLLAPAVSAEALTVEWSRTELRPHPSDRLKRVPYVHIYRDRREDTDMKIPGFVGRTALFPDQLRVGNVSLWIHNVTLSDNGTYRCHVPNLRSRNREALVSLIVDPLVEEVSPTETLTVPRQKDTDPDPAPDKREYWMSLNSAAIFVFVVIVLCGCVLFKPPKKTQKMVKAPLPVVTEVGVACDSGAAGDVVSLSMVKLETDPPRMILAAG